MSNKKFWQSDSTLESRVKAVQNVNDPAILSDDIQRWSKAFMYLLLAFTTFLGAFSYFKFFEASFGFYASVAMAVCISITIEFGKNWGGLKALRMPFFMGFNQIFAHIGIFIMFVCVCCLSFATFFASVSNSTKGAEMLSLVLANEKNEKHGKKYDPGTTDIDGQISSLQKSSNEAGKIKWNGVVTYQAQKTIERNSKSIEKLLAMKAKRENSTRADFEKGEAIKDGQSKFNSNALLLVGGFVELLQGILLFLRVSSEKTLEDYYQKGKKAVPQPPQAFSNAQNAPQHEKAGFYQHQTASNSAEGPGIQFRWNGYGQNVHLDKENAVPQSPQAFLTDHKTASDKVLTSLKDRFRREIPNFYRSDANPKTVFKRIEKELLNAESAMANQGFAPSYKVADLVLDYLQGFGFPALLAVKMPFERDIKFLQKLSEFSEKARTEEN